MKLAEALIERKGKQQKVTELEARITAAAVFQEGSEPVEDAVKLLRELDGAYAELLDLIARINRTNSATLVTDEGAQAPAPPAAAAGRPLSDLIAARDLAIQKQTALKRIAGAVRNALGGGRYSRTEIRVMTRVDVGQLEAQISQLGEAARKLDTQIQSTNWTIDLI